MPNNPPPPKELFCCNHLSLDDERDIKDFTVGKPEGEGLVNYIQHRAIQDEAAGRMRTYIVRDNLTMELVGYFSLKAGLISYRERRFLLSADFDTIPGIELADFAVNGKYVQAHPKSKGIGFVIFNDFIKPILGKAAEYIGAEIVYIFALPYPRLIQQYQERYGFVRLPPKAEARLHRRVKPRYDEGCVFMYQTIMEKQPLYKIEPLR